MADDGLDELRGSGVTGKVGCVSGVVILLVGEVPVKGHGIGDI